MPRCTVEVLILGKRSTTEEESEMQPLWRVIFFLILSVLITSCATVAERGTKPQGSPPVITHSFAATEVSHGDKWKIYVEASDPDGDMRKFVYTIGERGFGRGVYYVNIRKADRERMLGYLDVIIAPPQTAQAEWGNLTLTLYIRDGAGNSSEKISFPVAMTRGVKEASPPSPFNTGELKGIGTIFYKFPVPSGD
jgi:hypothetical protein